MKLILALTFIFTVTVQAEHHEKFEDHKKQALENIEKRLSTLQEHKTCVSSASDREALKVCRDKMKDFHMEFREERMEKKKQRIEKRMEKLKDKKESN